MRTLAPWMAESAEIVRTWSFLGHRKIEPRRVCTVDHIQVVVAGQAKNETGDPRILRESAEELGPLRRTARISDVSGNQDKVEWISRVDRVQFGHSLREPFISLRP
jgi:hypothetical protein